MFGRGRKSAFCFDNRGRFEGALRYEKGEQKKCARSYACVFESPVNHRWLAFVVSGNMYRIFIVRMV